MMRCRTAWKFKHCRGEDREDYKQLSERHTILYKHGTDFSKPEAHHC